MFLESLTTVEFSSPHAIKTSPLDNTFEPLDFLPALGFLVSILPRLLLMRSMTVIAFFNTVRHNLIMLPV